MPEATPKPATALEPLTAERLANACRVAESARDMAEAGVHPGHWNHYPYTTVLELAAEVERLSGQLQAIAQMPTTERNPDGEEQAAQSMQVAARTAVPAVEQQEPDICMVFSESGNAYHAFDYTPEDLEAEAARLRKEQRE
jgi:hypothetical protein